MGQKVAGAPKLSTVQVFFGGKMSRRNLSVGCYATGRNYCKWGKMSMGLVVHRASCLWGELSMGRVVYGASCLWGEMSWVELSMGRAVHGTNCQGGDYLAKAHLPNTKI